MATPVPRIYPDAFETARLRIRSPLPGDGAEVHAALVESAAELGPWLPFARREYTLEMAEESVGRARAAFLEGTDLRLHLMLKGTDTLVGSSGLHRMDWAVPRFEIGYWCRTRFQGQGYISEAVRGITAFAFEVLGARRVEIYCAAENLRSRRVAERVGYRLEGELRNYYVSLTGEPGNRLVFSLIPEEYAELKQQSTHPWWTEAAP